MVRRFRIAILPMYEQGFNPTPALSQAIDEMFITNAHGESIFQFWNEVTDGYLDIQATRLSWTQVPRAFNAQDVIQVQGVGPKITRPAQLGLYKQAVGALPGMANGGHGSYDALVYLLFPGNDNSIIDANGNLVMFQFEGGNWTTGGDLPTAILPVATAGHTHTFLTHEVGHLFGLRDSQGIFRWNGSTWDSGYGDPLNIMSAQNWFAGDPTHPGQAVPNWPTLSDGGIATNSMGPAPSLAELHLWDANCLPSHAIHDIHVVDDNTPSFRLNAAYGDNKTRRLAIIRPGAPNLLEPPGGLGRLYLEFRNRRGWDIGFDKPGAPRTRTSLVAHVVQTGERNQPQAFYKGQIIVPIEVDTDLNVPGTPYTVRILQFGADFVTVKVTRTSTRGFKVDAEVEESEVQINPRIMELRRTPCGDLLHWGTWKTKTIGVFTPTAWGYGGESSDIFGPTSVPADGIVPPLGQPALTLIWFVGGKQVPEQSNGTLSECQALVGSFTVDFELNQHTRSLTLSSRFGDHFKMSVRAQMSDTVLGLTENRNLVFESQGSYIGYPPADVTKIARCGARLANELRIDPDIFRLPDGRGPRPNWHDRFRVVVDDLRRHRPQDWRLLDKLADLGELAKTLRQPS